MTTAAGLISGLMARELARSPVKAARLGLAVPGPLLPDMSEAALTASARTDQAWLTRLAACQPAPGTGEAIDRDLAISALRGRAVLNEWQLWRRSPELYTTPVLLAVQALAGDPSRPRAGLAREAAAVLAGAPDLTGHGRRNLDPELAHPRLLRRAAVQARAGAAWCQAAPSLAAPGDAEARKLLAEAGETAATAFEDFARHLAELAEAAHGTAPIGENRYNNLLRTAAGSRYDTAGIHALGQAEISLLRGRIAALRAAHPELATAPAPQPAASLAELTGWYQAELTRARAFCADHAVLTLPDGEECTTAATPRHRLATLPVASYDPPPLLAGTAATRGRLLIPVPPDGSPGQAALALARQPRAGIAAVTVHEAYPGHHAHYARMAATVRRHPLRGLFTNPFHSEGWGVYAEKYAHAHGYFTRPGQAQAHLTSLLVRAVRAAVEPALHSGGMTVSQASTFLEQNLRLTGDLAEAEIDRYLAYPTQAASYLAGAAEITEIAEQAQASDQLTHDTLTSCGSLPLNLLRQAASTQTRA
jgi:uncharacterized protein (DUF885 family)